MEQSKFETRNLWLFFLIAFAFTWLFWILEALAMQGRLGSSIITDFLLSSYNPAAWGPFVAAFLLTYLRTGKDGVTKLLRRGIDFRFNKVWLIPTLFLWPAIMIGGLLVATLAGDDIPELLWASDPSMIAVYFFTVLLFQGPLQEEFGWRGYALDRLQARFNALNSSVILGLMWGLWHFPYMFTQGEEVVYQNLWGFMLSTILLTILFTWLYNNTGGSILVALIFHTTFNYSAQMFPALETEAGSFIYMISLIAVVIAVIVIWRPKRLVREKQIKKTSPNSG
ncbi:MAG: type II CAAX endopeptidase family protein [Halobacteriota archaeon]|nr:type II CAAX endopeptidase family protein [Halobacteriota archaeon]